MYRWEHLLPSDSSGGLHRLQRPFCSMPKIFPATPRSQVKPGGRCLGSPLGQTCPSVDASAAVIPECVLGASPESASPGTRVKQRGPKPRTQTDSDILGADRKCAFLITTPWWCGSSLMSEKQRLKAGTSKELCGVPGASPPSPTVGRLLSVSFPPWRRVK